MNIKYLKKEDKYFPKSLYLLNDCPDILYVLGNEKILNDFCIAIVGSRNCSEYGKSMTEKFTFDLIKRNINIVSGMAIGIDKVAHETCTKNKCKTIAVLGGGFNNIFPKENIKLFYDILENGGAVITEYMPDEPSKTINFPHRNRIVAALSNGLLVIEAREKSGALITVKDAIELNKKIFVVPANLDSSKSKGSNSLMNSKAKCVTRVEDLLVEFPNINFKVNNVKQKDVTINEEYLEVYKLITKSPIHIDEIKRKSKENISKINYVLMMLELDGHIKQLPNKYFKLI